MSFSYDRYDRRQSSNRRTTFGYWVPLVFTLTVATAGAVAWIWSERREDDDTSDDADLSYGEDRDGKIPQGPPGTRDTMSQGVVHDDETLMGRVHGVMRRTPSPQQLFDTVSKKTAAGVAAAGAAAGAMLASIREEDRDDFGDHSRWSEEAALRRNVEAQSSQSTSAVDTQARSFAASVRGGSQASGNRKTVAIIVSAESLMDNPHDDESSYRSENAVRCAERNTCFMLTNFRQSFRIYQTPTSTGPSFLFSFIPHHYGLDRTRVSAPLLLDHHTQPYQPLPRLQARSLNQLSRSPRTPSTRLRYQHVARTVYCGTHFMHKHFG